MCCARLLDCVHEAVGCVHEAVGCGQGFWERGGSWWPGTVQALRTDGAVVLKVDPTPNYPQVRM